jgi:signal transduction histidine kinase
VRLKEFGEMLDATIDSVRRVCRVLRPVILDELGLAAALEWQVSEFRARTGIPCAVQRPETLEVEPVRATALFRVVQELLTNIARHAHPRSVQVELRREEANMHLRVQDDGCGLPEDVWTRRDRFGLLGVRERILAIQGMIEFSVPAGGGTRVDVWVPCA